MTSRFFSALAAFGFVTVALAACGGAEAGAPAKSAAPAREEAPAPEPRTIEEAQEQIARASADLKGASSKSSAADAKPAPAPESPSTAPSNSTTKTQDADNMVGGGHLYVNDACADPCRALASMRRAVDALCRMTGDTDHRCVDAKKTLADSVGRTTACKCS